jgi:hypothetical protein
MAEENVRQLASDFIDKLIVYKEPDIREKVFLRNIRVVPTDMLADVIMYVISKAYKKEGKYLEMSTLFTNKALLKEALGQKRMYELMRDAAVKGYKEISVFMLEYESVPATREIDAPLPDPKIEGMPVGLRKTLSKSHNRDTIEKLLYDQEPAVINVLLGNPKITETDIIKIVSKRPNSERILRTVYNSHRWKYRYRIQCSLAMNPYTPADITLSILPELFHVDLSRIINDGKLSDIVRLQAKIILKQDITL